MSNSSRPGIMTWATSIRLNMANDPGRQYVEDQVQEHGFKFLDDYLTTVLEGPKDEAFIELVKTPGRRKDAPKRTRTAVATASKMKSVISVSNLAEDEKENGSSNKLMQDLLRAQASRDDDTYSQQIPETSVNSPFVSEANTLKSVKKPKSVTIASPPPAAISSRPQSPVSTAPASSSHLSAISEESSALSAAQPTPARLPAHPPAQLTGPIPGQPSSLGSNRDKQRLSDTQRPSRAPSRGLHERPPTPITVADSSSLHVAPVAHTTHQTTPPAVNPQLPTPTEALPAPLNRYPTPSPEPLPADVKPETVPAPQVPSPVTSSSRPMEVPSRTPAALPRPLSRQTNIQVVPLAFPRSSTVTNFAAVATPGAGTSTGAVGKRTSWLRKVRESKPAIDFSKRMSAVPSNDALAQSTAIAQAAPVRVGSKRSSGDMLAGAPDEEARRRKSQKITEAKTPASLPAQTRAPVPAPTPVMRNLVTSDEADEDPDDSSDSGEDVTAHVHTFRLAMQGVKALKGKSLGANAPGVTEFANAKNQPESIKEDRRAKEHEAQARHEQERQVQELATLEVKRLEGEWRAREEDEQRAKQEAERLAREAEFARLQEENRLVKERALRAEEQQRAAEEKRRAAEAALARLAAERQRKEEEERERLAVERRAAEERELERLRVEAEKEKRRKERLEQQRLQEEARQQELARKREEQEERRRQEEEQKRREEAERKQQELERKRKQEELERQRQSEEARKRKISLERRRLEEQQEEQRQAELARQQQEELDRQRKADEARRRKVSLERRRLEEEREKERRAELALKEEEDRRQREEAEDKARQQQQAERLRAKQEQERRLREEAEKRRSEEQRRDRERKEAEANARAEQEQTHRENAAAVQKAPNERLSVSDLVTSEEIRHSTESFKRASANVSISTTPPDSPPARAPLRLTSMAAVPAPVFKPPPSLGAGGVFSKPKAVFTAPPRVDPSANVSSNVFANQAKEFFQPPGSTILSKPSVAVPVKVGRVSKDSTKSSFADDSLFDTQERRDVLPSTQNTEYSSANTQPRSQTVASQSRLHLQGSGVDDNEDDDFDDIDEDASWRIQQNLSATQAWRMMGFSESKRTEDTWSTVRTQSHKGDTSNMKDFTKNSTGKSLRAVQDHLDGAGKANTSRNVPGAFEMDAEVDNVEDHEARANSQDDDMDLDVDEPDLHDLAAAGKPTIALVKKTQAPASDDSQMNFFGQASKFVASVLGGGKKEKAEPVKSVQMAKAAARQHQGAKERQAERQKQIEARRQAVLQRKAEEEKARQLEAERKLKEDVERRKREREENTDKRPLKLPVKKGGEEDPKKKLLASASKPPPSKDKLQSAIVRPVAKPKAGILKQPSSSTLNAGYQPTMGSSSNSKSTVVPAPSAIAKGKGKATIKDHGLEDRQPAKLVQKQMQDRTKAQVKASLPPREKSEDIELPDIASEYSDSDDEDRKSFQGPDWAQSPEIAAKLQEQAGWNPDDIFGAIQPLHMEEIFRGRASKFRARTSSANWAGTDGLTADEERAYAKRMGYK